MNQIKVEKTKLLTTLAKNRDAHMQTYKEAEAAYRKNAIEKLSDMLAAAQNGEEIETAFHLPVVVSHEDDFNTTISMLEWSTGEEVELSQSDFEKYVLNNWSWSSGFMSTASAYMSSTAH